MKRRRMNAFVADVARFLDVEPEDIKRMIQLDGLPAFWIPQKTRRVLRIPLRDFHAWLVEREKNPLPRLGDFETFLIDFNAAAGKEAA